MEVVEEADEVLAHEFTDAHRKFEAQKAALEAKRTEYHELELEIVDLERMREREKVKNKALLWKPRT